MIPQCMVPELAASLGKYRAEHARRIERGGGRVQLPTALARKDPSLETAWGWQWVFPAERDYRDRIGGKHHRHHVYESTVQRVVTTAVHDAGIVKRAIRHTLRHSFATHLLEARYDIRTVQELRERNDVRTTMIYAHVLNRGGPLIRSPADGYLGPGSCRPPAAERAPPSP